MTSAALPPMIPATAKTLVLGYGSELRGDDALGPRAAEVLADRLMGREDVCVLSRPSLTPELAAELAAVDRAILIDCAAEGEVGVVVEQPVEPRDDGSAAMVHFLDAPALLHWTRKLYGRCPETIMISVAGRSFEISETLTPLLDEAKDTIVARVMSLVAAEA